MAGGGAERRKRERPAELDLRAPRVAEVWHFPEGVEDELYRVLERDRRRTVLGRNPDAHVEHLLPGWLQEISASLSPTLNQPWGNRPGALAPR